MEGVRVLYSGLQEEGRRLDLKRICRDISAKTWVYVGLKAGILLVVARACHLEVRVRAKRN